MYVYVCEVLCGTFNYKILSMCLCMNVCMYVCMYLYTYF